MAVSRAARIKTLLVIDALFFLVELSVGYAVGSLALVADSFHMLNDILSLLVALYAIKLTTEHSPDSNYSYGWQRAEILSALINGVFLLALCFSISLEALERFFKSPEISNPKLVVLVGSLGLASNIVGLFLFHEHGHSHSHSHSQDLSIGSSSTSISSGDYPPQSLKAIHTLDALDDSRSHISTTRTQFVQAAQEMVSIKSPLPSQSFSHHGSRVDLSSTGEADVDVPDTASGIQETVPLLETSDNDIPPTPITPSSHHSHSHSHSHSGSMNMHGILLHVLGDAMGNIGVIVTGLIIWHTDWTFKHYLDPTISLVITCIIFFSALPLVRSASFILLQGVPSAVSLDAVRKSIQAVEGVLSVHELHVWQLSEAKIVASVHVMISLKHDFMQVGDKIRRVLHLHGIHSSTIQPEYPTGSSSDGYSMAQTPEESCCPLPCPPGQGCNPRERACCPPPKGDV